MVDFVETKYETDTAPTHVVRARVSQAVIDFRLFNGGRNNPPSADVTVAISATMSTDRKRPSIGARGILVEWTGEPPEGYDANGRLWIPVLRPGKWRVYKPHELGEYLGQEIIVVSKRPEVIN